MAQWIAYWALAPESLVRCWVAYHSLLHLTSWDCLSSSGRLTSLEEKIGKSPGGLGEKEKIFGTFLSVPVKNDNSQQQR